MYFTSGLDVVILYLYSTEEGNILVQSESVFRVYLKVQVREIRIIVVDIIIRQTEGFINDEFMILVLKSFIRDASRKNMILPYHVYSRIG